MIKKIFFKYKVLIAFVHDFLVITFAWLFSYLLRFNFEIPDGYLDQMLLFSILLPPIQSLIFVYLGLYKGLWRFSSLEDLKRIIIGSFLIFLFINFVNFLFLNIFLIPRSITLIFSLLIIFGLGFSRFLYRLYSEKKLFNFFSVSSGEPLILIGAGSNAVNILKELSNNNDFNVIGILDNDKSLHNREILKTKILSDISYLPKAVKNYGIKQVIISYPNSSSPDRVQAIKIATQLKLKTLIAPPLDEIVSGRISYSNLRNVDINDLLGRNIINLHTKKLRSEFYFKTILVSGAGGSVGSELCRQLVKYKPKKIIFLDISEFNIYKLEQFFSKRKFKIQFIYILSDVKNKFQLDLIFQKHRPEIVFHAAAYKHVPIVENNNLYGAFQNNVIGTYNLALISSKYFVSNFILISTDKAVNPTNIMGATKRLSEMVCQCIQLKSMTKFITVRFGNVLDSSGSVIPKFRSQIEAGGPITVTHPKITRFFMAIPEAAQLVLQAATMGNGGEIFVLDMGEPVKINDLAKSMIRLSGYSENQIKIKYTGLRPGEKLYEEILIDGENILPTRHNNIFIAKTKKIEYVWLKMLICWINEIPIKSESQVKRELSRWVEEYKNN